MNDMRIVERKVDTNEVKIAAKDVQVYYGDTPTPAPTRPCRRPYRRLLAPLRHIFVRRATAAHHDGHAPRYATYLFALLKRALDLIVAPS